MPPDPRTGLETIPEEECWELLASNAIGRIAVSVGQHPDIFPVNYGMDGRDVVILTLPGIKLAAAVLGQSVTFEIDHFDTKSRTGWSVVVHGVGREIEGPEAELRAADLGIRPWTDTKRYRYLRIVADRVAGRRVR